MLEKNYPHYPLSYSSHRVTIPIVDDLFNIVNHTVKHTLDVP